MPATRTDTSTATQEKIRYATRYIHVSPKPPKNWPTGGYPDKMSW